MAAMTRDEQEHLQKEHTTLINQVIKVRELQKRYFKHRNDLVLRECKTEESKLDSLVKKYNLEQQSLQKNLF